MNSNKCYSDGDTKQSKPNETYDSYKYLTKIDEEEQSMYESSSIKNTGRDENTCRNQISNVGVEVLGEALVEVYLNLI